MTAGSGPLTVSHHPMVRLAGTGRLATSPKRLALTPETPLEPDCVLRYPASHATLSDFPGRNGAVDITHLPIGTLAEDFVTLVEGDTTIGWTAILRDEEDDIVFFLKNPSALPVTSLWHSNGGRRFPPWNGKHSGVVGVEDGCTAGLLPSQQAGTANAISSTGVKTCLQLSPGRRHRIAHVTGAIARPKGWRTVSDIQLRDDRLILTGETGSTRTLAFPGKFLELET